MSRTNFDKLARWDADWYKSLSDDDCIVCLTQKEVYLLIANLHLLEWSNTRWVGDTSGMDFKAIRSELEYKLSEDMSCKSLSDILNTITQLQQQINYIYNETIINEGDLLFDPNETVINDVYTPDEFAELSVATDDCNTADKDKIYGAIDQLVRYISQGNTDFLEQIEQNIGNIAEQASTVLAAFPPTNVLTLDDIADWTQFITEELLEEYNATVDEDLIQTTICDLFCIAVAADCHLDIVDVINYFGSKVSPTLSNFASTFLSIVQFGLIGSFSGDMYFHYMCYFQMTSAAFADAMGADSLNRFGLQIQAGFLSPSNAWTILCTEECPNFYRIWTWDFAWGLGDWIIDSGTLEGGRVEGVDGGAFRQISVKMVTDPTWRFVAGRMVGERVNGLGNGTNDVNNLVLRPTPGSNTGGTFVVNQNFGGNGIINSCGNIPSVAYVDGINEISVFLRVSDPSNLSDIFLDSIELQFDVAHYKPGSLITEDSDICS